MAVSSLIVEISSELCTFCFSWCTLRRTFQYVISKHVKYYGTFSSCQATCNMARTHAHADMAHFPTRCIIRDWEALGRRLGDFQFVMKHWVGKCAIPAWVWVLVFIPWPVRNIKAAVQISHISAHPFLHELCLGYEIINEVICFRTLIHWGISYCSSLTLSNADDLYMCLCLVFSKTNKHIQIKSNQIKDDVYVRGVSAYISPYQLFFVVYFDRSHLARWVQHVPVVYFHRFSLTS